MSTTCVRLLTIGEWQLYRAVRLSALTEAPEAFGSTVARERAFPKEAWQNRLTGRNQYIAERGGAPCGLVGIIPDGDVSAELVSLWVRPEHRGRGVGLHLVAAAIGWAHEHGLKNVHLRVAERNHPAEQLYTRLGFTRTGESISHPDGSAKQFAMLRTLATGIC